MIVIFTAPLCARCAEVKALARTLGLAFREIDGPSMARAMEDPPPRWREMWRDFALWDWHGRPTEMPYLIVNGNGYAHDRAPAALEEVGREGQ